MRHPAGTRPENVPLFKEKFVALKKVALPASDNLFKIAFGPPFLYTLVLHRLTDDVGEISRYAHPFSVGVLADDFGCFVG